VICLFIIYFSPWFSLGMLNCPKNLSISSRLFILLAYSFCFCVACCELSFFISNFIDLILLPFILMSLANGLSIYIIFSRKQLLVLLIFTVISFIYFSFISALIYMLSFYNFGFFSFSSCFICKVCCCCLVTQLCPTVCNPMVCSPPGSSVHGILQARILECIAIFFSRGSYQPRNQTLVSCIAGRFFTN